MGTLHVYLDEAGDLGFSFARPYRAGGSSRYLTLAFLIAPAEHCKYAKRLVRDFRASYGMAPTRELKGLELSPNQLKVFAERLVELRTGRPSVELRCMTVRKENVKAAIRADPNKLYNYMARLSLVDRLESADEVQFFPDPRSVKVASGRSLVDYLGTVLLFDRNASTRITQHNHESGRCHLLQVVDLVARIVWQHYEDGDSEAYRILGPAAGERQLYFGHGD